MFMSGKKKINLSLIYLHMITYLHASSSQACHSKIFIPYSQTLRLNRICSENLSDDKRCNDLEVWLRKIPYHANVSNLKDTMSFLPLLLTPDQEHQKVFQKVPITDFSRAKSLKDIRVRAKVPPVKKNEGCCGPYKKLRAKFVRTL